MNDPLYRAYEALRLSEKGQVSHEDPKVHALLECIAGTSTNTDLCYAWDKFQQNKSRMILTAFMLAEATFDIMRQTTGIPMAVLQAYATHIYDDSVFRDRLDRIEYVEQAGNYLPHEEARYYRAAITVGSEYIIWLLNGKTGQTPKSVLRAMMVDSAFRAQEHRSAAIDSEIARAALNWAKSAVKSAADLQKIDPQDEQDAMDELRLALGFEDTTINATTKGAPQPEDILH